MKRFALFLAVITLFAFKTTHAQYIPFSAKTGLEAARKAVLDSGYTDAYIVSIQTIWSGDNATIEYDSTENRNRWNGLEFSWDYLFFQKETNTHYNIQIMRNEDSSFVVFKANLPEGRMDTTMIPDDNWLDSDQNTTAKQRSGYGEGVKLYVHTEPWPEEAYNRLIWGFGYAFMDDIFAKIGVDAYTSEIIYFVVIGSVQSENPDNLCAYPNPSSSGVTVTSDNFCSQFEMMNIFMSSGKKVGTVLCSPNAESVTIPASTFPSNGQYFLKLSGKKNSATLPVTIQGR